MAFSGYFWSTFILEDAQSVQTVLGVQCGVALILGLGLFGHSLMPSSTKSEGIQGNNPTQLGGDKVDVLFHFYFHEAVTMISYFKPALRFSFISQSTFHLNVWSYNRMYHKW